MKLLFISKLTRFALLNFYEILTLFLPYSPGRLRL